MQYTVHVLQSIWTGTTAFRLDFPDIWHLGRLSVKMTVFQAELLDLTMDRKWVTSDIIRTVRDTVTPHPRWPDVSARNMYGLAWLSPQALKKSLVLTCLMFVERKAYNFSGRNRPRSFSRKKSGIFPCLEMRMLKKSAFNWTYTQASIHWPSSWGRTLGDLWQNPRFAAQMLCVLISHLFLWPLLLVPLPVQAMTPRLMFRICMATTFQVHDT